MPPKNYSHVEKCKLTKSFISCIAMPRTGHHAVMRWINAQLGVQPMNVEGYTWDESMRKTLEGKRYTLPVMVIRDYPNWAASVLSYFTKHQEDDLGRFVSMWMSHVEHAHTIPTILYDRWLRDGHGTTVLDQGSMFDGGSRLTRYQQRTDDPRWPFMMSHRDALELSESVFGQVYVGEEVAA